MIRLLAAMGICTLSVAVLAAPPLESAVSPVRLVEQLGSESYSEREAAVAALERSGPAVVPALEAATRDPNPEVSKRAAQILTNFNRRADANGRLNAKPVRLAYKQIPLGTAVNDLKARTGINLVLDAENIADPLRLVTCESGELPPWEAVAAFCLAAGLKEVFESELPVPKQEQRSRRGYYQPPPPPPLPEAVPVKLTDGNAPTPPGSRSTAVRVIALPGRFPKNRVYLGTGEVLLHFDVAPMPGLHWRTVNGVRITKVVDDAGRPGSGSTSKDPGPAQNDFMEGAVFIGGMGGGMAFRAWDGDSPNNLSSYPNPRIVPVPIKLATPSARTLKLLEGTAICEISIPNQPLATIDNIAESKGKSVEGIGGVKLVVVEVKAGEKGGKSIVKVQTESPAPWLLNQRMNPWGGLVEMTGENAATTASSIKGFDAAGKPVRLMTLTTSQTNNDEMTMTTSMQFTCPDGLPWKLVLMGSKPVMVEVPFKMENVTLP